MTTRETAECLNCGKPFHQHLDGRKFFCSRICGSRYRYEERKRKAEAAKATSKKRAFPCVCEQCGQKFEGFTKNQRFCSKLCNSRNIRAKESCGPALWGMSRPTVGGTNLESFRVPDGFGGWMPSGDARVM